MKPVTTFLILFLAFPTLFSQTFQRINAPVTVNGQVLLSPWAGGMNAPQWSKADLNGDGKLDMYAFDRDGFVHIPFLNVGEMGESRYQFAPEFAPNFPPTWNFVLLRDFNGDGVMDFFGHSQKIGIPGLQVYRGYMDSGQLKFNLMEFNHWVFDVITVPLGTGGFANMNINRVDYPALDDMDGDGDLDILALDPNSGRDINFYKNFAVEQGLGKDTLVFRPEDDCWGGIYLPDVTDHFQLSGDPDTCAHPFAPQDIYLEKDGLHGASTLCTFDEDNDGDKEVLYGDLNFPQILKGVNGGTLNSGWITDQDVTFPSYNSPVHLPDFPNSFHFDFDNDGLTDLLFNPNEYNLSPDVEVWFYKNVTSNEFPQFSFSQKDAMVEDMIDVGKGASPAFFDYNADGLMDFVIGNYEKVTTTNGSNKKEASLYLYKNIGTTNEPAFELVDKDWLGFKQYTNNGNPNDTKNYAPAFGDLDQDGDQDLLVGEAGQYLFFVENTAGAGNPAIWGPIIPQWKNIRIGNYPTPCIFDLNKDGLADLLVGEQGGNINYLPNIGSPGNPIFHDNPNEFPNNKFLGAISTQVPGVGSGFSAPVMLDFQDTIYLMTGSVSGFLELYEVDTLKLELGDTFNLISKNFAGLYTGTHSRIAFNDINDDDILEAIVGNHRGGVMLFASPFKTDGSVASKEIYQNLEFNLFPNPTTNQINIEFNDAYFGVTNYQITNALGRVVDKGLLRNGQGSIDVSHLSDGIYFIQIKRGDRVGVRKLVIRK